MCEKKSSGQLEPLLFYMEKQLDFEFELNFCCYLFLSFRISFYFLYVNIM